MEPQPQPSDEALKKPWEYVTSISEPDGEFKEHLKLIACLVIFMSAGFGGCGIVVQKAVEAVQADEQYRLSLAAQAGVEFPSTPVPENDW